MMPHSLASLFSLLQGAVAKQGDGSKSFTCYAVVPVAAVHLTCGVAQCRHACLEIYPPIWCQGQLLQFVGGWAQGLR